LEPWVTLAQKIVEKLWLNTHSSYLDVKLQKCFCDGQIYNIQYIVHYKNHYFTALFYNAGWS